MFYFIFQNPSLERVASSHLLTTSTNSDLVTVTDKMMSRWVTTHARCVHASVMNM